MKYLHLLVFIFILSACSVKAPDGPFKQKFSFAPGDEDAIREALITMEDSTEVILAAGKYSFEKLSIQGPYVNVMFRGAGREETVIDFSGQTSGGKDYGSIMLLVSPFGI